MYEVWKWYPILELPCIFLLEQKQCYLQQLLFPYPVAFGLKPNQKNVNFYQGNITVYFL
jgi:hypothetical protein